MSGLPKIQILQRKNFTKIPILVAQAPAKSDFCLRISKKKEVVAIEIKRKTELLITLVELGDQRNLAVIKISYIRDWAHKYIKGTISRDRVATYAVDSIVGLVIPWHRASVS